MSEQGLLSELKAQIAHSAKWRRSTVTVKQLESLVRKYEIQTPGDVSQQPGEWEVRGGYVDAIQHDGSQGAASHIRDWIKKRGGNSQWLGTYDQEVDHLRILLDSPRQPNVVGPGWWVVRTADGIFFAVADVDFHIIYVPRTDK